MSDQLIWLTDKWTKAELARAVPGAYWSADEGHWVLDPATITPRAALVALKLFPELILDHPWLGDERDKLIQEIRPFDNATPYNKRITAPLVEAIMASEDKELYDFQALDLGYLQDILTEHGGGYLGWERGMGKTIGALCLTEALERRTALFVAPNSAKATVWEPDISHYLGDYFDKIFLIPNEKKARERQCTEVLNAVKAGESVGWIVHYEALAIIAGKSGSGWKKFGEWGIVIADEAHRIKNLKAKMTRSLKKVPAAMKLCLSGSIIQNHIEELFSPLQWLFPKHYSAKWRDWNDRFLDYVEGGFSKVFVGIKPETLDDLRKELGVFMVYRRKEDELDMPERVDEDRFVTLSRGQRKAYDDLIRTCLAEVEGGDNVVADDGLPMLIKLRQIATGLDLVGGVHDSTKLDLAAEIINDNEDEQFVVFSWFKAACTALQDMLGDQAVVITGDVPQKDRAGIIEEFKSGEKRVLIATISTMGESQNFQNANNVIFLDRSWNPSDNTQAADRVYRIGQDKKVTITHIIAKDTADERKVTPTLMNKESLRRMLLGG